MVCAWQEPQPADRGVARATPTRAARRAAVSHARWRPDREGLGLLDGRDKRLIENLALRASATGAVIQHFTRPLNRVPDVDFRLPTLDELDALEAFILSLGRQEEPALPLPLKGAGSRRGPQISSTTSKATAPAQASA
jgi:hypothetical protein